ncbi:MAG: FAD-dependent oxidoreductase, partial [Mesorhizobium sp.]
MAGLPTTARVVIIGGGVVGCSSLYHLCKAGWTDCVLLEKNELTSGSTWHAAGNVPTFSSSWSLMNMQRYSTELYRGLAEAVDYPMNYHVTGSLRLAHTKERMQEFQRAKGMGRYQGMDIDVVGLDEIKRRYPFIETHELKGALYDPSDGDIDPAQLTQALAKGARDMGAKIIRFCPVSGVRRENGEWVVETPQGEIRCEIVINAAGYRAAEVGKMFGRDVPMMVMSHQYILFEEIPELAAWTKEQGHKLPLLRDVDTSYYLRQEKSGMNLGPYERNCRAHWATHNDPMPEDFSFQLFPDDLDRLEHYLADAVARVPILGTAGLSKVINGPIPYAPDGNPLIGPMPGVPNAFEACVFTFGIAQGGGAGKVLAEWVTGGQTEWDMWSCDPRRFTSFASALDYCAAKGMEIYGNEYAIQFPRHAWPEGRNRKLSPLHERVKALGGQFDAYNGWERATWYARPGDDTSEEATLTFRRDGPWQRAVREECLAVRDAAGILDLPGFSRFNLEGPGAAEWLALQVTGLVPKPGRIGLVYFSDDKGRIVTEMSVVRHREDLMTLITAAVAQWHDFEWLKSPMPADAAFTLTDRTEEYSTQILAGPNSRKILAELCDADLSQPWLTHQETTIAGRWAKLVRVSFAGELGWEIHSKVADTLAVFDAVWAAGQKHGLKPFGMYALDSLRLEKGYRTWKGDLSTDYSILQGGLERFVKW